MGDIIWIILLLVMAWFLFVRPKDSADDDSDSHDSRNGHNDRNARGGRPSPSDLRPPPRHQAPPSTPTAGPASPGAQHADEQEPGPREASDAYRRAQAMWDALRSTPASDTAPGAPARTTQPSRGFDQNEFLDGARMVYARIQESWDARDLDDIREFVDEQVLANLRELAAKNATPTRTTILTLDATFLDLDRERDREVASVRFRVRMAKGDSPPYLIEEIWHFGRDIASDGAPDDTLPGMWKVVGISQVG